jgi:hypothetical protein
MEFQKDEIQSASRRAVFAVLSASAAFILYSDWQTKCQANQRHEMKLPLEVSSIMECEALS